MPASIRHDPRIIRRFRQVSRAAAWAVLLLGFVVVAAWLLDLGGFWFISPLLLMKFSTAVCFALSGTALLVLQDEPVSTRATRIAQLLGSGVLGLAVLTLLATLTAIDFSLESLLALLYAEPAVEIALPAPNAMLGFVFIGIMLVLFDAEWGGRPPARYAFLVVAFIAFISALGHLYDISPLYQIGRYSLMPPHAAVGLLLVVVSALFARPKAGLTSLLAREGPAGLMARSMTPVAILLPVVAGWLARMGRRAELYDAAFGYAIFAIAAVVGLLLMVAYNASRIEEADEERRGAEAETRRLNRRLLRQAADLTAANKELEAFSYSVSHDLRAPLRAIDGFSLAVLEDEGPRLTPDGRDYLVRVRAASQRMGDLIDGLLQLSRLSRLELEPAQLDLGRLVTEKRQVLQEAEPERSVTWSIAEGVEAEGDSRLLRALLDNLLDNAWKFTRGKDPAIIEFGAIPDEGGLVYYVRDNGAGFDMEHAGKLFGAFQRLHGVSEFEGLGIGLATAQRIIRRHGGRIWAEGRPGQGAVFYFTLGWAPSISGASGPEGRPQYAE
jgi:signal transduction histidine kinase